MLWGGTPPALAARFAAIAQRYIADGPAERADRARRNLLAAVAEHEPATHRRRLAMRLTDSGKDLLTTNPKAGGGILRRLERLAPSELRAVERAIEILER
jgi:hypothetical protein